MRYCGLKKTDIANGLGVRVSLFVSGCRNRCAGCFQPETWDFDYGDPFTPAVQREVLDALRPVWIQGLSILGGEPMEPENQAALFPFLLDVKEAFPDKDIWLYTGFPYEKVADSPLLSFVDVVVDGKSVTFTLHTDAETLGAALVAEKLVEGEESQYGLYIKKVNGMTADYEIDKSYWSISKDGKDLMTGADGEKITDGAHYALTRAK